jgi:hypothetical protein
VTGSFEPVINVQILYKNDEFIYQISDYQALKYDCTP